MIGQAIDWIIGFHHMQSISFLAEPLEETVSGIVAIIKYISIILYLACAVQAFGVEGLLTIKFVAKLSPVVFTRIARKLSI